MLDFLNNSGDLRILSEDNKRRMVLFPSILDAFIFGFHEQSNLSLPKLLAGIAYLKA
jgi:hypothetical protein